MLPTLTVAVISRNEAPLLQACLERTDGADELLVLDMESSDNTREIAARFGAKVLRVPLVPIAEQIRQIGVDAAESDWLLWVDADERLPVGFLDSLSPHLGRADVEAYFLEFRDVTFGRPTQYMNRGASKVALMRPRRTTYSTDAAAHQRPQIAGRLESLVGQVDPIEHLAFRSVRQVLEKTLRYAESGGGTMLHGSGADPFLLPRMLWTALVMRGAVLDGTEASVAATMSAYGEYLSRIKVWEAAGLAHEDISPITRRLLLVARVTADRSRRVRHTFKASS